MGEETENWEGDGVMVVKVSMSRGQGEEGKITANKYIAEIFRNSSGFSSLLSHLKTRL